MKSNESRSERRVYWVSDSSIGLWAAYYRPINRKTGQPWQAPRSIGGHDCYRLSNYNTHADSGIIMGKLPHFDVWTKVGGGMTSACTGFSSEALALAAIAAAKEAE